MDKTLLTMGMPVYNEEKYIAEAIESLLAQTYKNFTLIISDNASTDRTPQICKYYAKRDKRIVYVRHEKNMGSIANGLYLIEQTKTPFFMLCGGHDKWHPSFVEKLLPALREENVILSYSRSRLIKTDGTMGIIYRDDYTTVHIDRPADRYFYILRHMKAFNISYGIWLTKALKNFNLNFRTVASDHIVLAQAAFEGKFKQYNEVLFFARQNREDEDHRDWILRQFAQVTGKKSVENMSVSLLWFSFILENIKVIFRKRYSLNIFTKLWLTMNILYKYIFYIYILNFHVKPALNITLKKILPDRTYSKLRSIWDKRKH